MDKQEFIKKLKSSETIVIKIGSAVVSKDNSIDFAILKSIVSDVVYLVEELSKNVVIVSSGAVAGGMGVMGIKKRPDNIVHQQALASIGQPVLMDTYGKFFKDFRRTVSQVLITIDDIQNRRRFINAKNSLNTLLKWNIIPIVNENDTVVVKELKIGDNDNLSSYIVNLVEADALIILTNVDGVYNKNPRFKDAKIIECINSKNKDDFDDLEGVGNLGSGGIKSKIESGLKVARMGKLAVVINGKKEHSIRDVFTDCNFPKTVFEPFNLPVTSKKSWIENCSTSGVVVIDNGAVKSIKHSKSLLASGIDKVYGTFGRGDIINIESGEGTLIAKGVTNYDSLEIEKIKKRHSSDITEILGYKYSNDVVHINNMIVFE